MTEDMKRLWVDNGNATGSAPGAAEVDAMTTRLSALALASYDYASAQGLSPAGRMTFVHEVLLPECTCCSEVLTPDEHWEELYCRCDTCPRHGGAK